MQERLKPMDNLALNCGVSLTIDDPKLHETLEYFLTQDGELWNYLGTMFSLCIGMSNYFNVFFYSKTH